MDAGKMALQPEPVLLNQLTDEVFSSFWRSADEKGIKLVNDTEDVPTVMIEGIASGRFSSTLSGMP